MQPKQYTALLTATSSRSSPLVPCKIFTRLPMLFSQIYSACCRAEPATMYSPSPEKQHFFHGVLKHKKHPQEKLEPEPREGQSHPLLVTIPTYSPSPAVSAWAQALHPFHTLKSLCHHRL